MIWDDSSDTEEVPIQKFYGLTRFVGSPIEGDSDIFAEIVVKINLLSLRSRRDGNSIFRSRRPGLNRAGSRVSARFVAMMTFTLLV